MTKHTKFLNNCGEMTTMMKTNKSMKRILSLLVLVVLVLTALPTAALADSFSAAVKSGYMMIYADAYGQYCIGALPAKTIVTVLNHNGSVAQISYNGRAGYAKVSDMVSVASISTPAWTSTATRVYQYPSTASASVAVAAGMQVNILAVKGGVAMVECNGKVGYMFASHLSTGLTPTVPSQPTVDGSIIVDALPDSVVNALPDSVVSGMQNSQYTAQQLLDLKAALEAEYKKQQAAAQQNTITAANIAAAFTSGKYSNEQLCYLYATTVMGYNSAAAAGLLANISAESGFRTNANGDSGRSYGICQWFSSRKTRLLNWCSKNGLDASTLFAQLSFLKHELETYYPSVNKYMKSVSNSAAGAYDAAYYFCYHFEAPANKASKSKSRGSTAQNTYYPRYAA